MKKYILLYIFILLTQLLYSQRKEPYYIKKKIDNKYFISAGVGIGSARWNSLFENTEFYDKDGSIINTGDFHFGARSPINVYDLNVLAPIGPVRLGLGIAFEYHYLSQLKIYDKEGSNYLLFDEMMRFDKLYFNVELPVEKFLHDKLFIDWNMRCGWFGYTNVKRVNFIGEKPFPLAVWVNTGAMVSYMVYPQIYVYAYPNIEFKYYSDSRTEAPVDITHRIFSFALNAGVRVDLKSNIGNK